MPEQPIIIIGSGFAGSVAAATLCDAGHKVVLLERGPWRDTAPVRSMNIERRAPLPSGRRFFSHLVHRLNHHRLPPITLNRRGVYEMHTGGDMNVVCSNQVGGGSHVYGGLNMRPALPDYWDGHHDKISSRIMEPHYRYILDRMGSSAPSLEARYPNMFTERMAASDNFVTDQRALDLDMGIDFSRNPDAGQLSTTGMLGSPEGLKITVDALFLRDALAQGLQVQDMCEVTTIHRDDKDNNTSYRIVYFNHHNRRQQSISTDKLIMAAGTINTLKLLFHSRDTERTLKGMPALGKHFSGNGDYTAYWRHPGNTVDLSVGLPVRGRILLSDDSRWTSSHPWPFVVEGGLFYSGALPWPLSRFMKNGTLLAGMGDDNAMGTVHYRKGKLRIAYHAEKSLALRELRQACDLIASLTNSRVTHFSKPMTVHPLGGARLGASPQTGVIDHNGEVFGHPGLYIADGAALPGALGAPPSISIAAWARQVALSMIQNP